MLLKRLQLLQQHWQQQLSWARGADTSSLAWRRGCDGWGDMIVGAVEGGNVTVNVRMHAVNPERGSDSSHLPLIQSVVFGPPFEWSATVSVRCVCPDTHGPPRLSGERQDPVETRPPRPIPPFVLSPPFILRHAFLSQQRRSRIALTPVRSRGTDEGRLREELVLGGNARLTAV